MQNQGKMEKLALFQSQVVRLQRRIDLLQARSDQYTRWRMLVFSVGTGVSLIAIYALALELGIALAFGAIVIFSVAVALHRRVERRLEQVKLWQQVKADHIARMQLNWQHIPVPPEMLRPEDHPFATDLNLLDERSLHHLLDTSLSYEGSQRLADWLLNPIPEPSITQQRQSILAATRQRYMFRDKLRVIATIAGRSGRIRGQRILDWFEQHPAPARLRPVLRWAGLLSFINILLFLAFLLVDLPPLFLISLFLYFAVQVPHFGTISELFTQTRSLFSSFSRLQTVFRFLEKEEDASLAPLLQVFQTHPPSRDLRALMRVMVATSAQQNPLLALLLNTIVPYDLFFANLLERHKQEIAPRMREWLEAWFELEALNSLANLAYLKDDYQFPTFDVAAGFQGQALGHPLLKDAEKVRNDFLMRQSHDVVIITGSNMAGKSTFLRTLGVNLVLAYAGGVVDAEALHISWFRVFSSIKVTDSINDGISYFYAEVRRLKALLQALDSAHNMPIFFLIDEIFRGTNNRERLIGSRAYIRTVAQKNGVGLIATHDLELVRLADEFDTIRNFHFREDIQDNRMIFDYKIRQGPCPTTNALKIMEIEGLPIA